MTDRLAEQIRNLAEVFHDLPVAQRFLERLAEPHALTRDEYPPSHFCVYFAAYDPQTGEVFVGHHIKSGLWIFNGGHIDRDETAGEALRREVGEEWGVPVDWEQVGEPKLLTITQIEPNPRVPCKWHYDIWYFVPVRKDDFHPDPALLATEYHEIGWRSIEDARAVIRDANTLQAIELIEKVVLP